MVNTALGTALTATDVIGAYAGLRPLIDTGEGRTADVSREHAVVESASGVISVIGGKLTEYRYMAQDVLDRAIGLRRLRRREVPDPQSAVDRGAGQPRVTTAPMAGLPVSLVLRYGAEAAKVIAAAACERPAEPVAEGIDVTRAEFEYAITHEGALAVSTSSTGGPGSGWWRAIGTRSPDGRGVYVAVRLTRERDTWNGTNPYR